MPEIQSIRLRRDTAANWTAANPVLSSGEVGLETDSRRFKIGDGTTTWSALAYWYALTSVAQAWTKPQSATRSALSFAATTAWDMATIANATLTLTGPTTLAVTGSIDDTAYYLWVKMDAVGLHAITWPGTFVWSGGAAPAAGGANSLMQVMAFTSSIDGTQKHYATAVQF